MTMARPDILLNAPIMAFDYEPDGNPIHPCGGCLPWHVEVIVDSPDAPVLIREWHAIGCPVWDD